MKLPNCKKPCSNCPYRKDSMKGWLGKARAKELVKEQSFVCHKTTQGEDKDRLQCAGHMLLMGLKNSFVLTAKLMGIKLTLSGREQVFETEQDFIKHQDTDA